MTAYRPVLDGMLMRAATVVQPLCIFCASLAGLVLSFTACFILLVIAPLKRHSHYAQYCYCIVTTALIIRCKSARALTQKAQYCAPRRSLCKSVVQEQQFILLLATWRWT